MAATTRTPAQELLDFLGPVTQFQHENPELGDFGMPNRMMMEDMLAPIAAGGMGPLDKVHAFWIAGMSCDGCSIAATSATTPSVESLVLGSHPGIPRVVLHHPVLNMEAGPNYLRSHEKAIKGMLPSNKLGRAVASKLKVYAGPDHPHAAQQPVPYEIKQVAQ